LPPTAPSSGLTNQPKHLPTKADTWANSITSDKHKQHDPTASATELPLMIPTTPIPSCSPTHGNTMLELAVSTNHPHSNITAAPSASPQPPTALHLSLSACISNLQKQLEAIQLSLQKCTTLMKHQHLPPKLQDCPLTDPLQDPSINQPTIQPDPRAPPLSAALPVPSLLIDFSMFGQPWHTFPIHFAHPSPFRSQPHTNPLHTAHQPNNITTASSSSRILSHHQLTQLND